MLLSRFFNLESIGCITAVIWCLSYLGSLPPSTEHDRIYYFLFLIPLAYLVRNRISFSFSFSSLSFFALFLFLSFILFYVAFFFIVVFFFVASFVASFVPFFIFFFFFSSSSFSSFFSYFSVFSFFSLSFSIFISCSLIILNGRRHFYELFTIILSSHPVSFTSLWWELHLWSRIIRSVFTIILLTYWNLITSLLWERHRRRRIGIWSRIIRSGLPEPLDGADHQSQTTPPAELLNDDLIQEVAKRLPSFKDLGAMSSVSRGFRKALSSCGMLCNNAPFPPVLILTSNPESETRSLRSLHNNNTLEIDLPAALGGLIWGSQYGWMITVDPQLHVQLLQPFSQKQVNLPNLSSLNQKWLPKPFWFLRVEKLFVFNINVENPKYLVMVILKQENQLGFTRPGDAEWVLVSNTNKFHFSDVIYVRHKRQVYALCDKGIVRIDFIPATRTVTASHSGKKRGADESLLEVIDFRGPLTTRIELISSGFLGKTVGPQFGKTVRGYLVESSDTCSLFAVFRSSEENTDSVMKTVEFTVYRLDPRNHNWIAVDDIGENAFFVGHNNSWSICPANEVNFHNSSIYFTDDNLELEALQSGGYDIGVYDVRSGQFGSLDIGAYGSSYLRSTWVTLSTPVLAVNSLS